MIALEPLRDDHLDRFPIAGFPLDFWRDEAVVAVESGEILGICCISVQDETATVGILITPGMKRHTVFLHRNALYGIEGLRRMGVKRIRAESDTEIGIRWLKRLGFAEENGWYVRWLLHQ